MSATASACAASVSSLTNVRACSSSSALSIAPIRPDLGQLAHPVGEEARLVSAQDGGKSVV